MGIEGSISDLPFVVFLLEFALGLVRVRGTKPGTLPCVHSCGVCVLYMVLNSLGLLLRHRLQLFANNGLLEMDERNDFSFGDYRLLVAATMRGRVQGRGLRVGSGRSGIGWGGGFLGRSVGRRDSFGVVNRLRLIGLGSIKQRESGRITRLE